LIKKSAFAKASSTTLLKNKKRFLYIQKDQTLGTLEIMATKPIRESNTTYAQFGIIVEWLETPENFKLITGAAAKGKAMVAGNRLKKVDAYAQLADRSYK
jgi:hypothetical protein